MSAINPNWVSAKSSSPTNIGLPPNVGIPVLADFPITRMEVPLGMTLPIPAGFQLLLANTFSIVGIVDNEGEVVIL